MGRVFRPLGAVSFFPEGSAVLKKTSAGGMVFRLGGWTSMIRGHKFINSRMRYFSSSFSSAQCSLIFQECVPAPLSLAPSPRSPPRRPPPGGGRRRGTRRTRRRCRPGRGSCCCAGAPWPGRSSQTCPSCAGSCRAGRRSSPSPRRGPRLGRGTRDLRQGAREGKGSPRRQSPPLASGDLCTEGRGGRPRKGRRRRYKEKRGEKRVRRATTANKGRALIRPFLRRRPRPPSARPPPPPPPPPRRPPPSAASRGGGN